MLCPQIPSDFHDLIQVNAIIYSLYCSLTMDTEYNEPSQVGTAQAEKMEA